MENHDFAWENSLYMAMFNGYVELPEGTVFWLMSGKLVPSNRLSDGHQLTYGMMQLSCSASSKLWLCGIQATVMMELLRASWLAVTCHPKTGWNTRSIPNYAGPGRRGLSKHLFNQRRIWNISYNYGQNVWPGHPQFVDHSSNGGNGSSVSVPLTWSVRTVPLLAYLHHPLMSAVVLQILSVGIAKGFHLENDVGPRFYRGEGVRAADQTI